MSGKISALCLVSGGLDSLLAAILIKKQNIKTIGLVFKSLFFDPALKAKKILRQFNIPCQIIDFSQANLEIVKNPTYGYGKNANPCLDCHLLMLKYAKKIMLKEKYFFIVTGEVLGQRSFSQHKNSLLMMENKADLKGLILRPLSAKLLTTTIAEKKGWVNRNKLLDISGRSRKIQLALAKKYNLSGYSAPGTSCILTDPNYSRRFFNLKRVSPNINKNDIKLLSLGHHYYNFKNNVLIVSGRNHQENQMLKKYTLKNDIIIEPKSFSGSTILLKRYRNKPIKANIEQAKKILLRHSPKAPKKTSAADFSVQIKK